MTTVGFEHVTDGLGAGNGVILALPHLGGWEWAAFWLTEVLATPGDRRGRSARARRSWSSGSSSCAKPSGMEIITLGPSAGSDGHAGASGTTTSSACCATGTSAAAGVEVEFFGERTTLPGGPATLALRTGAPLLPAAVYFRGTVHHEGVVRPPLPAERPGGSATTSPGSPRCWPTSWRS